MKPSNKNYSVVTTTNYNQFIPHDENRDHEKTKALLKSMQLYEWLPAYPMHVIRRGEELVIVDGQHRFDVARALKLPVRYVLCAETNIDLCIINNAQKPWSTRDYVTRYVRQCNPHYVFLLKFQEEHRLPLGICAKLLMGLGNRETGTQQIKAGRFEVRQADSAHVIAGVVASLRAHVKWAANSFFVDAICRALDVPGFSIDKFCQRCNACPGLLVLQPTTEKFLELIEYIYNFRSRSGLLSIKFQARKKAHSA